jgi:calcium-dependent protein kinase
MTTWSNGELQGLRDAFILLDSENKGEICVEDLRQAVEQLQQSESECSRRVKLQPLVASLQKCKPNSYLSFQDFLSLMTSPNPNDMNDDVQKVFDLFDADGKGYINMDDLRTVATDLGENNMTDTELHEMIQRLSSSGRVTLDQFRDIMNKKFLP